jgi:hypothetical protein
MSGINSAAIEAIRGFLVEGEESGESSLTIDDTIEMEFPLSKD